MLIENEDGQVMLFDPDLDVGKMSLELSARPPEMTSKRSSRSSFMLRNHTFMLLDLRPGAGNILGPCWEYNPVWLGPPGTLNTSECPKGVVASSLSQILVDTAPSRYYLSQTACLGILRRAEERGKELPWQLERALRIQAGIETAGEALPERTTETAINQRRVADDPAGKSVSSISSSVTEIQTFFAQAPAGFLPESSSTARDIGYQVECAPTLKAGGKTSAVMLSTLCLNDQGGKVMGCSKDVSGTLRAQEHGHQPLVFENHGIDARYTGPFDVAPTMAARYGTGGNNTPLVTKEIPFCITGNAIDRKPENGGNGLGIDADISFTLTATDHHAVFARQRVDVFREDGVASTESARQHKDATDLILEEATRLSQTQLIRRLLPVECERLQGYPDGWTDIPGASDSSRYKALGNSVAIPCVELLVMGIALVVRNGKDSYATVEALCKML